MGFLYLEALDGLTQGWERVSKISLSAIATQTWVAFGQTEETTSLTGQGILPKFSNRARYPRLRVSCDSSAPVAVSFQIPLRAPELSVVALSFGNPQEFPNFIGPLGLPSWGYVFLADADAPPVIPPPPPPQTTHTQTYDDLSYQIDGTTDTFHVSRANYLSSTLFCSVGGLIMRKNVHFFETQPSSGTFRMCRPLTEEDAPLIMSYLFT